PGRIVAETIYLAYDAGAGVSRGQGILKSTDGGQSWISIRGAPGFNVRSLVVDPIRPSALYARSTEAEDSIFKSTDGGKSSTVHTSPPAGTAILSLAIDPTSPSTLYAVYWTSPSYGIWGILKSMDSGENWTELNTGLPTQPDVGFPGVVSPPLVAV